MTDEERVELLGRCEEALNQILNGASASSNPNKRFVWGMVAYDSEDPADNRYGSVLVAANTQDTELIAAIFTSAAVRMAGVTLQDIAPGIPHPRKRH